MFPSFSAYQFADRRTKYAKAICQILLCVVAFGIQAAYFAYSVLCQFCAALLLSACNALRVQAKPMLSATAHIFRMLMNGTSFTAYTISSLGYHVVDIILRRSQEKMVRTTAWRIVALMTDKYAIWDRVIRQFIRNPMGILHWDIACYAKSAIPFSIDPGSPQPALTGFVHFRPESIKPGWGIIEGHIDLQSMCRAPTVAAVWGTLVACIIPLFTASQSHKCYVAGGC